MFNNPRLDNFVHTVIGVLGTLVILVVIVAYARAPGDKPRPNGESDAPRMQQTPALAIQSPDAPGVANEPGPDANTAEDSLEIGETLYVNYCQTCHGMPGEPRAALLSGSDLFDGEWAYGSSREAIRKSVADGIIEEGMVPWKSALTDAQIDALVNYMLAHQTVADAAGSS